MKRLHLTILAAIALASCGDSGQTTQQAQGDPIGASPMGCGRFFVAGKAPLMRDPKSSVRTKVLCRRSFAVYHSGVARQPLWVAEALTREQIKVGFGVSRVDNFHADPDIDKADRAELKDYARSGYDRGHMAPDADMPTRESADQAFALSNMSPQRPNLNRRSWADLEAAIRRQTRGGTVYVLTGPLFIGGRIETTHKDRRLLVPTHFFKAVYAEDRGATVFIATNSDAPRWMTLTVEQFKQVHGIDPFPGLAPQFRNENGVLDGSMNRIAAAAGASGATANSPASNVGITTCSKPEGGPVRNPTNGNGMTVENFRNSFGREPVAEDYCGNRSVTTGGQAGNGQPAAPAGGQEQGSAPYGKPCDRNGPQNIRNPTNGNPMTAENFRNAFGREPGPEDYCR